MRKIFIVLSLIASVMTSFYIEMYVIKETDEAKFLIGYMLIALCIFGLCLWAYEWARVRDERKEKIRKHKERRKQNEIRETNSRRD